MRNRQHRLLSLLLTCKLKPTLTKSNLAQHVDPRLDVTEVEGIVETTHLISTHFCNLGHLGQLLGVASDEVEEREAIKVLGPLVSNLDNLWRAN